MIGQHLKFLRSINGTTQRELAEYLNVSQQTVGSWEVGRTQPDDETVKKASAFFFLPPKFLRGDSPFDKWDIIQHNLPQVVSQFSNYFSEHNLEDAIKKFGISENGEPISKLIILLDTWISDVDEQKDGIKLNFNTERFLKKKNKPVTEDDRLREENNELFDQLPKEKKQEALNYLRFLVEHQGKE